MEISVSLNREELEILEQMTPAIGSRQDVIRAFIFAASQDTDLKKLVVGMAVCGERMGNRQAGEQAGLTPEDYAKALRETGSIRQAAKRLRVSRSAVRQARDRHNISY